MSEPTQMQKIRQMVIEGLNQATSTNEMGAVLESALGLLRAQTDVKYGCHCDLEPGQEPDECVLDEGRPENCIYAKACTQEGRSKWDCQYWHPVIEK